MQQTEKYKLNLIETTDTFSPAPLNENAQKLEAALTAQEAARAQAGAALDARVQALELHRMAAGTYTGDGSASGQMIEVGFTPEVVVTDPMNAYHATSVLCLRNHPFNVVEIVPGGFIVRHSANYASDHYSLNSSNGTYRYLALC